MSNRFIQPGWNELLSYRLTTARQKKRRQKEDFDKSLLELHWEQQNLWEQQRNLGWEPLLPPIQKGWKRTFILQEEVAGSKHAEFFENILQKINTVDWSWRKEFVVKKRKRGRKIYVEKVQHLLQPDEWKFSKLNFSPAEKQFFHAEDFYDRWGQGPKYRFVFNEPWRFVLKVKPNMIDKIRKMDGELESRLKEIENYLQGNCYKKKMWKLAEGRSQNTGLANGEKHKCIFKNKPFTSLLDHIREENNYSL